MKLDHGWSRGAARRAAGGALLAAVCTAALAAGDRKGSQFYEDALSRFDKKDYAGAVVQLKNALQQDRNTLQVHLLLGKALMAQKDVGAAEVAFTEALRLGVDPAEVIVELAESVDAQGRPDDVLSQPRFADAALPQTVRAQLLLVKADAAEELGRTRESLKYLEDSRALDSTRVQNWLAEVPIRLRQKQFAEARAAAEQAIRLDPQSAAALYLRGQVSHLQGDLKGALDYYDRAVQLGPTYADARVARAGVLVDLGRADEAAKDIARLREVAPRDPRGAYLAALQAERAGDPTTARAALGVVTDLLDPVPIKFLRYRPQLLMLAGLAHHGLGQLEKARPYLEAVLRQQPRSPVSKLLAEIYARQKDTSLAIQALEAYLRNYPNDGQAKQLLAAAQMSKGRYAESAALMQGALKQQDLPAMRSLLGLSLIGGGKIGEGATELEAVLKKDPGNLQAGTTLVSLYLQAGLPRRAISIADSLLKQQPDNPGLNNLRGMALVNLGDTQGARTAFDKAARIAPAFNAPVLNLARLDIDARDYDGAAKRLNPLLAKDEQNAEALLEAARLSEMRGRYDDAQHFLEKADDFGGTNLRPGLQLVDFHLRHNQPELARRAMKRLLAKQPDAMAVLLTQARVQLAGADAAGAKTTLGRASAQAGADAPVLTQIAFLQWRAGDLPGASLALDRALAAKPDHRQANALKAGLEIQQGNYAKAEQRARGLVANSPKSGVGHALLADLALARRQQPAALDELRRAHQLDQTDASLLRLYSVMATSDPAGAARLAEQWLKTRPGDVELLRALADDHARNGNFAGARSRYEALLKVAPDDAEALNNLANMLVLLRDPGALKVAERALALRPESAHILGSAGWAAFHAGQIDRSLQLLRDARLRDPGNADTRYFLGVVLADRGRKTEARDELEGALRGSGMFSYSKEAQQLLATLR